MNHEDRKKAIRDYKETPRPVGVFQVRNEQTGKLYVEGGVDVRAAINRCRATLAFGSHPVRELQEDWKKYGEESFTFDILDFVEPTDDPGSDPFADRDCLLAMWLDKLRPYGDRGYNTEKKDG